MVKRNKIEESVKLPEGVQVKVVNSEVQIKGPQGEVKRTFISLMCSIDSKDNKISVYSKRDTKKEKKELYAFIAHIKNMIKGVKTPYLYKLKICSSHFPMNVSVSGNKFSVKNFIGEKLPRELQIHQNVEVKVSGDEIVVKSCDKELAGETASNIELLTNIKSKDRRVFQDGIFISEKPAKDLTGVL